MLTRRTVLAGSAACAVAQPSWGQSFPSRSVTILVPYPPGGPIDTLARLIAQEASADLGQPMVVENRPGGGGLVGTATVARADPDGHMMILGTNQTHATNQNLIKNWTFDAVKDFAPVAGVAAMPHVLVVRKEFEAKTLAEFVAAAKAKPGKLTFGSSGNGSSAHLAGELFKVKAGLDMLHVPLRGVAPMVTEILAGRIDFTIGPLPGMISQQLAGGAMRGLAIASARRTPQLPDLPTFAEGGVAGVEADAWSALFVPAKTPPATVERLYKAVASALAKDSVRAQLGKLGLPVAVKTPAEMSAMIPGEIAKWAEVIRVAKVTME